MTLLLLLFLFQCIFLCLVLLSHGRPRLTSPSRCPLTPPGLVGYVPANDSSPPYNVLERIHDELENGGRWRPTSCTSIHQVALVVPFRDRHVHLRAFLAHIHPFLQRQQIDYGIFVVEQTSSATFNRGMLMNIGFVEALKQRRWDCFIFHDVDLLPENDHNIYSCPELPRHMSVAVDTMAYRLMYESLFGGIEAFTTEHFRLINGFSNQFFGWGAEDDDLYSRVVHAGLNLTRYPSSVARYHMLDHARSNPNPRRQSLLMTTDQRFSEDGLSSLPGSYRAKIQLRKLYTLVYADINQKYIMKRFKDAEQTRG